MNSDCLWLCELGSCGGSKPCGLYGKRSEHSPGHSRNPYQLWNDTTHDWDVVSEDQYAVHKRSAAVRGDPGFREDKRWNPSRLDNYLVKCDNAADEQFPSITPHHERGRDWRVERRDALAGGRV